MSQSFPETAKSYHEAFDRTLLATLATIDRKDMNLPLCVNVEDLFPIELRQIYGASGYALRTSVGMSVLYLMLTHSSNMCDAYTEPGTWKRWFPDHSTLRRRALAKAHAKIRAWLIAGPNKNWDHNAYPRFLSNLGVELERVIGGHSPEQMTQLANRLWMTKVPPLATWKQMAERALL